MLGLSLKRTQSVCGSALLAAISIFALPAVAFDYDYDPAVVVVDPLPPVVVVDDYDYYDDYDYDYLLPAPGLSVVITP